MALTQDERIAACRTEAELRSVQGRSGRPVHPHQGTTVARSIPAHLLHLPSIQHDVRTFSVWARETLCLRRDCPADLRLLILEDIWADLTLVAPESTPASSAQVLRGAVELGLFPVDSVLWTQICALAHDPGPRGSLRSEGVRLAAARLVLADSGLGQAQLLRLAARFPDVGVHIAAHAAAGPTVWRAVVSTLSQSDVADFVALGTPLSDPDVWAELQRRVPSHLVDGIEWCLGRAAPDNRGPWLGRLLAIDPERALRRAQGIRLVPSDLVSALVSPHAAAREAALLLGGRI